MLLQRWFAVLLSYCLFACGDVGRADYDPLVVPAGLPEHRDLTIKDEKRTRDIPIRIYLPGRTEPQPVVIFSPGLGGTAQEANIWGITGRSAAMSWCSSNIPVVTIRCGRISPR